MTMETNDQKDLNLDVADLNRNVLNFCGSVLVYYQDILNDSELVVCKLLIKGQSLQGVSNSLYISRERVRQIFNKAIKKIRDAHQDTLNEMAKLKDENEALKVRNHILEEKYLSEQSMEQIESVMSQEKKLCCNAKRLLNTPISNLPLSQRCKTVLDSAKVLKFSELPLLSETELLSAKRCGKKTIHDLQAYLHIFSLELNLTQEEVITRMAELNDEDISPDDFKDSTRITMEDFSSFSTKESESTDKGAAQIKDSHTAMQSENANALTLDDICAEIGTTKKNKKKWGRIVKRILLNNNIDTLEKLLSLKPSEFIDFEGVGKTTLYYTRKAIESFGFVWSDVHNREKEFG